MRKILFKSKRMDNDEWIYGGAPFFLDRIMQNDLSYFMVS